MLFAAAYLRSGRDVRKYDVHMATELYDVKSVTKAAIGLMYAIHKPRASLGLLNMTAFHERWSYAAFRTAVNRGVPLKAFAKARLTPKPDQKFEYCNLAYQILASDFPGVSKAFGEFVGRPVLRKTDRWYEGDGWKWEHSHGEHLGPHGLRLSNEVGVIFGERARSILKRLARQSVEVNGNFSGCGKDVLDRYSHGWFFTADERAFAVGYVAQIIAVTPTAVKTHFYKEDWSKPNKEGCKFISSIK
jgi:hypothetical protein